MGRVLGLKLSDSEQFLSKILTHHDYLDCVEITKLHQSIGDEKLYRLCVHNKVATIAADALVRCYDRNSVGSHWLEAYDDVDNRIGQYMDELERTSNLLATHGIPLVALKNSGITKALYPYYGACPMGDIDVLVRKSDFRKGHSILIDHGYTLKFRSPLEEENLERAEQGGGAEYAVELPDGSRLWFELQWRPVAGRWIRPDQEPSADDLMARSVAVEGSSVRLLSPEDNLLQVALHTAKHTFVRAPGFRLHTDVDRIVRSCEIDWDIFLSRVCSLQVKTAVYLSLAFAHDLLATPIPSGVLDRLKPSGWKLRFMVRWLERVGLFDPDGKKWGRVGYIIFVSLLYDDLIGFVGGVMPPRKWMMEKYKVNNPVLLAFYYLYRIADMLWKRTLVK